MAAKIGIRQKSYSRMETGETKEIKDKYIQKLSELYLQEGKVLKEFLESEAILIINQSNHDQVTGTLNTHQNLMSYQERNYYEKQIKQLKEENKFLRQMLKGKITQVG